MIDNRFFFNFAATIYDLFTSQEAWREHCRNLTPDDYEPKNILDVGCGPGISAFVLENKHPDTNVFGLDIAEKMIRRAQKTKKETDSHVDFMIGNAEVLPFASEHFEFVTGHSFLYLLENRKNVLKEIYRVTKSGGRFTFLEPRTNPGLGWINPSLGRGPRFFSTMIGWQIFSSLHRRFDQNSLKVLLEETGFTDVTCEKTLNGLGWLCRGQKT